MDTAQIERTIGGVNGNTMNYTHCAYFSMEDIVHSMKGHLLDQHAQANGSGCHNHDNVKFKGNIENVDPTMEKQSGRRKEQSDLVQEEWFADKMHQNKVSRSRVLVYV